MTFAKINNFTPLAIQNSLISNGEIGRDGVCMPAFHCYLNKKDAIASYKDSCSQFHHVIPSLLLFKHLQKRFLYQVLWLKERTQKAVL